MVIYRKLLDVPPVDLWRLTEYDGTGFTGMEVLCRSYVLDPPNMVFVDLSFSGPLMHRAKDTALQKTQVMPKL